MYICIYNIAIEVLINDFELPEEVAGVTLVAFAAAAPEILLNSVSALQQQASVSLPASLGSSIIAFGLIPPCCVLFGAHDGRNSIETIPIIREVCTYKNIIDVSHLFLTSFTAIHFIHFS